MDLCLAPLVLAGFMQTIETSWHKTTNLDGAVLEVQTCDRGLGLEVKASSSGLYGLGMQYGFQATSGPWSITALPKAGLSYVDHPVYELPQRTQFELGAQILVGYERFRIGVEYWHLSDAGMKQPNIGLDMVIVQTGWRF